MIGIDSWIKDDAPKTKYEKQAEIIVFSFHLSSFSSFYILTPPISHFPVAEAVRR